MTGQQRVCGWYCLLVIIYITSQLVDVADAQAYHFSKGWMPGRKRFDAQLMGVSEPGQKSPVFGELDRRSAAEVCAVKSQAYQLALDVLKEGFERLAEDCEIAVALHGLSSAAKKRSYRAASGKAEDK